MASIFFTAAAIAVSGNCDECTANNGAIISGQQTGRLHAWCFAHNQCMELRPSLLTGCSDFTFENSQCGCAHYKDCATCANSSHLDCVWVANATVQWQMDLKLPIVPVIKANKSFVFQTGRCKAGSAFTLKQEDRLAVDLGLGSSLNFTSITKPDFFYWATCDLTAMTMLDLIVGGAAFLCLLCALCCCFGCVRRRRARARSRLIEHPQVGSAGISIEQVAEDK